MEGGANSLKMFGTDLKLKYIIMDIDGKEITVSFYDTYWKGIHNVLLRSKNGWIPVKIKSAYPGLVDRIQMIALLIWVQLQYAVKCMLERN